MPDLIFEKRGAVAWLTMNRPERRNAMTPQMILQLEEAWSEFARDPDLRCAILTGAGDSAFSAGGDLGRLIPLFSGARAAEDEWDRALLAAPGRMSRALLRGLDVYKPIIAAINGLALGGGTELALATDLRLAAEHATFGLPEPRSGIVPGGGSMVRLPRQVGWCHAMQILLLGDPVAAPDALRMGLINEVVAGGALLARAEELATRIGRCAPVALAKIKEAALRSSGEPLARAFEIESECAAAVIRTRDAREGPRAFMEKRAPVWSGE